MKRKYGEEQRNAIKKITQELITQLELLYLKKFEELNQAGLGSGAITTTTQNFLLSREAALTPLQKQIQDDRPS